MSLNSQKQTPHPDDKVKFLYFVTEGSDVSGREFLPYFFVETRIDFNDVRTGFRGSVSLSKALEIYSSNAEFLWAHDMVWDVDPQKTSPFIPDTVRFGSLPDFVDANFISRMETQFIQYLLRSFAVRIHRNFALNLYSFSGESRADFVLRCLELCEGPKRKELDLLHEIFNRRLEQAKQKLLATGEYAEFEQARAESQNKDIFSHYSERIAELFLRGEFTSNPASYPFPNLPGARELEERLLALESEARHSIAKLQDSFEEKARALDEYALHPNLKDIHLVRSGILWMPKKAD